MKITVEQIKKDLYDAYKFLKENEKVTLLDLLKYRGKNNK